MTAQPTLEESAAAYEEEINEGEIQEESDEYDSEDDEGDNFRPDEDEDDDEDYEAEERDVNPDNLTAELLGKQNGEEEYDEEDDEYQDGGEGGAEKFNGSSSAVTGSKRVRDDEELVEAHDAEGVEEDGEAQEKNAKKVRV